MAKRKITKSVKTRVSTRLHVQQSKETKSKKILKKTVILTKKSVQKNKNMSSTIPSDKNKDDQILHNFFDAQSTIRVQCCICGRFIINRIKILLEPIPKCENINIKKDSLPFELICLKCLISQLKKNNFSVYSLNYLEKEQPHKYTHYRIINKMNEPIFTNDWSLADELKLLGGIGRLGIGNWGEISKILGKGKFECESHYYTFYYKKKNDYMPKLNLYDSKNYKTEMKKNKSEENLLIEKLNHNLGYIPFSIDINQSNRSININLSNSKSEHSNSIISQNACNILGYSQKRNEFDVEYKNDAEIELMEIDYKNNQNKENEPNNINELYDQILINYNKTLNKREERKDFIRTQNLFDVKKQVLQEKKLSKEDREIYQSVKQNMKYLSNEEFNDYFQSLILEKNLRSRLNQLLYYYKKGYKTYDQIFKYINEVKQKGNKIKNKFATKSNIKNLKISLRESTVEQVTKFNGYYNEDNIKTKKNTSTNENKNNIFI